MVYYNRILKVWVIDKIDYFMFSFLIGSTIANILKHYLAEQQAMERLKKSVMKKSPLLLDIESDKTDFTPKKKRAKKIFKIFILNRGGELVPKPVSDYAFKLAHIIREVVEKLAVFLKERELNGVATIFFKNGNIVLDIILQQCQIKLITLVFTKGINRQVVIITSTAGSTLGFLASWFLAGTSLFVPPLVFLSILFRGVAQSILNIKDALHLKQIVDQILEEKGYNPKFLDPNDYQPIFEVVFREDELLTTPTLKIKSLASNKKRFKQFDLKSDQNFQTFMRARDSEQLRFLGTSTSEQIQNLKQRGEIKTKSHRKTVRFKDFIDKMIEDSDEILDAEIVDKTPRIRIKNEEI